jgi:hypothetical protein
MHYLLRSQYTVPAPSGALDVVKEFRLTRPDDADSLMKRQR